MDYRAMLDEAERGDTESQYKLGLLYKNGGDGIEQSPTEAKRWLKEASKSGKRWIINDYVQCLVDGSKEEQDEARDLLRDRLSSDNYQGIRWYAKILLNQGSTESISIGKILLRYSAQNGIKWAAMDLAKYLQSNPSHSNYKELSEVCAEFRDQIPDSSLAQFKACSGTKTSFVDLETMMNLLENAKSNEESYFKMVDFMISNPSAKYIQLVDQEYLMKTELGRERLALMYKEGKILQHNIPKYIELIQTLSPEKIKEYGF